MIHKTLAQLLAEDPGLKDRLKAEGRWHDDIKPAWAEGSVLLSVDGVVRGVHPWKYPLPQDQDLDEPRPPREQKIKRTA